ncbi:MAG: 3-deoxy-D-manno-octulosonic acid transferase [Thermodesulfobacteriota bacterium]
MTFPLYTLAYTAAAGLAAPFYLARGLVQGKYLWSLTARLGWSRPLLPAKGATRIWIHALSLGEVLSSVEMVKRLAAEGHDLCLSTTTRSGFEAVRRRLNLFPLTPLPLDFPRSVRRTIEALSPDLFVLVETDIWPNLLAGLKRAGVPSVLAGARVSPRSLAGYRRLGRFWGRVLNHFSLIGCQSDLDRDRMLALGAGFEKLVVTGSLKFDQPRPETGPEVRARLLAQTGLPEGRWLVAGSTHDGEEDVLLDVFESLLPGFPDLRLLLAPRDQDRFGAVWRLIDKRGLPAGRRGAFPSGREVRVFLLDSLGELDLFYELARVVFVGKSLPGKGEGGGHNLIEPAARGKPVLFGPRMHNFPEIARLLAESGGGRRVTGAGDLLVVLTRLLSDDESCREMGLRAQEALAGHRGAVKKTINLIERVLAVRSES